MITIRKAAGSDLDAVASIYDELHRAEEDGCITMGWERGIYPVRATAQAALERNDLFVMEEEGTIVASGVINRLQVDVYAGAAWEHAAGDEQVCVLHTLAVSPRFFRRGCGTRFVQFYEQYAKEHGCTELRIDTNEKNEAARKLYRRLGYREIGIVPTVFNGIEGVNLVLLEKWLG